MTIRRSLQTIASLAACALVLAALPTLAGSGLNTDENGVALRGYDPVAYFVAGEPAPGDPAITAEHDGATYRFSSEENRKAFVDDPGRYTPQYGGWCAYAMARGQKARIDPNAFKVVDGRLYLNYSPRIQRKWERDIESYIASADEQWPRVRGGGS